MSNHRLRVALPFAALPLALALAAAHAAPQAAPAAPPAGSAASASTSAADDEDGAEQKQRRDAYIKRAFERFDANKDGKIDADEFHAGLERYLDRQRAAFDRDFADADANHDGKLSRTEARKANPVVYEHFTDIDTNHDGFLTKSEIRASIREQQARVAVEGDDGSEESAAGDSSKP